MTLTLLAAGGAKAPATEADCRRPESLVKEIERGLRKPCVQWTELDLASIQNLVIGGSAVGSGDFRGLRNLRRLTIKGLANPVLSEKTFLGLDSLEELHLVRAQVVKIEKGAFLGLSRLQTLTMTEGALRELDPSFLSGTFELETLDLASNEIASLAEDTFRVADRLGKISLRQNKLESLPRIDRLFGSRVLELDLSGNLLDDRVWEAFSELPVRKVKSADFSEDLLGISFIRSLNLSFNRLTRLEPRAFAALGNLRQLNLGSNLIAEIPARVFGPLKELERIWIDGNRIGPLSPFAFAGLSRLTRFSGSKNRWGNSIWKAIGEMPRLEELYLANSELQGVPKDAFARNRRLERLVVLGNRIERLEYGTFTGLYLSLLDFSDNPMSEFDAEWISGSRVDVLSLGGPNLDSIHGDFTDNSLLEMRVTRDSPLRKTSPEAFKGIGSLSINRNFGVESQGNVWF